MVRQSAQLHSNYSITTALFASTPPPRPRRPRLASL